MNNKYAKAYTEVIEIIGYFAEEEYNKIPKEKIEFYENNKDTNYIFKINPDIDLDKQKISKEAYSILVSLFRDYFATDRQKEVLNNLLTQNEKKLEEEKFKKYNPENIFKKSNQENKIEENIIQNEVALVEYKESIFKRFINKIKSIFNIK